MYSCLITYMVIVIFHRIQIQFFNQKGELLGTNIKFSPNLYLPVYLSLVISIVRG